MSRPSVFISYSHDSDEHTERVRGLDASLRRDGCDCRLDIHKDTDEDWPTWIARELTEADIVLCVVTETYERRFRDRELPDVGLGVGWEAGLIRRLLYAKKLHNDRIFPVFFDPADQRYIPLELQGYENFLLDGPDGYERLLRKILGRPLYERPKSGSPPDLPTHTTAPLFPRPRPSKLPPVARSDEHDGAESAGEYGATDNSLVKILDHTKQLADIRELLKDGGSDRAIVLVDACSEDWPSYLADHVHLDPWPDGDGRPPEAITLGLKRFDEQSFWEALLEAVPGTAKAPDEAARQAVIRSWIKGARLWVFYLPVGLDRYGRHLPQIIRGADETIRKLRLASGTRILVIIACLRNKADKVPFWWRWYAHFKLTSLERCHRLDAMAPLDTTDIDDWLARFPHLLRAHYNRNQLRDDLFDLFESGCTVRYQQVRRCLIDGRGCLRGGNGINGGALQRACRNPCP